MANAGLIILGILIIGGMFYFTHIYMTPQQADQILAAESGCNSALGTLGSAIFPSIASDCDKVRMMAPFIQYSFFIYIIGGILFVVGLAIGGKKEVIREVIKERESKEEPKTEETKKEAVKYCSNCGTEAKGKYCSKCGEEI